MECRKERKREGRKKERKETNTKINQPIEDKNKQINIDDKI